MKPNRVEQRRRGSLVLGDPSSLGRSPCFPSSTGPGTLFGQMDSVSRHAGKVAQPALDNFQKPTGQTSFLRLPPEVRQIVYQYIFTKKYLRFKVHDINGQTLPDGTFVAARKELRVDSARCEPNGPLPLSILFVGNHTVYKEVWPLIYSQSTFTLDSKTSNLWYSFVSTQIPSKCAHIIRHASVENFNRHLVPTVTASVSSWLGIWPIKFKTVEWNVEQHLVGTNSLVKFPGNLHTTHEWFILVLLGVEPCQLLARWNGRVYLCEVQQRNSMRRVTSWRWKEVEN